MKNKASVAILMLDNIEFKKKSLSRRISDIPY